MRILIAEDDQVLADGLLRSLRGSGYAVDQVSSGSHRQNQYTGRPARRGAPNRVENGLRAKPLDNPSRIPGDH